MSDIRWNTKVFSDLYHVDYSKKKEIDIVNSYDFDSILDVGCARGGFLKFFYDKGKKCIGLDVSSYMIKENKKELPGICFFVGDASDMSMFEDNCFDMVCCSDVLIHNVNWKNMLSELFRVSNGYIFLKVRTCFPFGYTRYGVEMVDDYYSNYILFGKDFWFFLKKYGVVDKVFVERGIIRKDMGISGFSSFGGRTLMCRVYVVLKKIKGGFL